MSDSSLDRLIQETRVLEEAGKKIQQGEQVAISQEEIKFFVDMYQNWYAECLALLPQDLIEEFRVQYDKKTGFFDLNPKIKNFLHEPTRPNILYNPEKLVSGITYWLYPHETAFRPRLLAQRQILLEASKRQPRAVPFTTSPSFYVDPARIEELRKIQSDAFDLSKLIRICEELNIAHTNHGYYTIGILLRTVLDHIPPVFGCGSFAEVSNNYSGTKSFKEAMKYLQESSRKISDSYLHTQIRKQEVLPNQTQVNFSANFDLLLSEIVRLLK